MRTRALPTLALATTLATASLAAAAPTGVDPGYAPVGPLGNGHLKRNEQEIDLPASNVDVLPPTYRYELGRGDGRVAYFSRGTDRRAFRCADGSKPAVTRGPMYEGWGMASGKKLSETQALTVQAEGGKVTFQTKAIPNAWVITCPWVKNEERPASPAGSPAPGSPAPATPASP